VKKNLNTVSAFQIYQLIRYSTLILTGIIFTKTALSGEEIGKYETFIFIAGAVSFFWINGMVRAFLPLSAESESKRTHVFSTFIILQFFSFLAAAFLFGFQPYFSEWLLNGNEIPETTLLLIFILVSGPASLVEYYYLAKKKNKAILVYGGISFGAQFILVVLPIVIGYAIKVALIGLVISSILRYAWLFILMIINSEFSVSLPFISANLKHGAPLMVAALLSGSAQFIDGFIITSKYDEATFAIFRYGARELPLALLLANALSNAMLPAFANKNQLKDNLAHLKSNIKKLMHLLFPLTIVVLLLSKPLFPIIFRPEFAESATIFNIYLLLIISRLIMPQTILNGLKITTPIMRAAFMELLTNVLLSFIFVQFWGLAGVAFATFFAYLLEKIVLVIVVKKRLNITLSEYLPKRIYLIYSFVTIVIFIFAEIIF